MIGDLLMFPFVVSQCPRLKKRYQRQAKRVKEYLESVKDFDELVSPQSLFLHFLGLEPSIKVRKNLEVVKKSEHPSPLEYRASVSFLSFFQIGRAHV